jgi:hypothetical protein
MGKPAPIVGSLSNVGVIMTIMQVLMVKLVFRVVMGWVATLECLLPGARGRLWLCPVMSGAKVCCFPRIRLQWLYLVLKGPPGVATGGLGVC